MFLLTYLKKERDQREDSINNGVNRVDFFVREYWLMIMNCRYCCPAIFSRFILET